MSGPSETGGEGGAMSTLRLLEPRALSAADRFGARVVERAAPLMRSVTTGSLGFSERLFHYWIGRNVERPPMARAAKGPAPAAMMFPRPWYDEPAAAAWPARGITLRAPAARAADASPRSVTAPVDASAAPAAELRAIDFVASYVEAPFPAAITASPGERFAAPHSDAAVAQSTGSSAAPAGASVPPRAAVAPRPSVASRLLDRLDVVDALLRGPRPAFTPATTVGESAAVQRATTQETFPRAMAPDTSQRTIQRSGERARPTVVYVDAAPEVPRAFDRPRDVSTFSAPALRGAQTFAPVATARPAGSGSAAFFSPELVVRAGAGTAAIPMLGPEAFSQTALTLDATLPIAVAWPTVQRFLETLAGPSVLSQAGIVAPTVAERFAPRIAVPAGDRTRVVPSLARELIAVPAPASIAPLNTERDATASTVSPSNPVPLPARAATAMGELYQVRDAAPASFQPGRLAQQAELLGRVAETRVARQLGFAPEAPARSVLWSADAFTFVAPDVFAQSDSSRAPASAPLASGAPLAAAPSSRGQAVSPFAAAPARTPSGLVFTQVGPVAPPAEPTAAPRSIAGVLSFVDRQIGARLARDTRALPVAAPEVVYVQASPDATPVATRPAASNAWVASSPIAMPAALDGPASVDAAPAGPFGRVAMRSEQIAGEVGVRIGALASEFLIDPQGNADASQGYAPLVPQLDASQRPWLSTQEWVLLSMFPSTATAHEVAASAARRSWSSPEAATTSLARDPGVLPVVAPAVAVAGAQTGREGHTGPRGSLSLPSLSAALRQASDLGVSASETSASSAAVAEHTSSPRVGAATAEVMSQLVAPAAFAPSQTSTARAQLTQRLPDGRAPRGSRLFPRIATPVVAPSAFSDGGAPTALLAGSEAAERRVESPIGSPLWGHLRPMVAPTAPAAPGSSSAVSSAVAEQRPLVAPRRAPEPTTRSVAMELIAPFVEAARAEPTTGAASFGRAETPVVSASAPDAATRSLVTALAASQAAGAQSSGDRLTMADLTLISFVSQTQQVAAAAEGEAPMPAGASGPATSSSGGAGGSGQGFDDADVERLAERVHDRLRSRAQDLAEQKGDHWER